MLKYKEYPLFRVEEQGVFLFDQNICMGLQSGEIPFGRGNASLLWCHNMGEDKCTLYKNPAFLLGKRHFLVYKREVEL